MKSALSINQDFVVLSPDKKASVESCDDSLYRRLDEDYNGFAGHELISSYEFNADWPTWEMHPHGDEVVILLAGETIFVLQEDGAETFVHLKEPGQYAVVPKGVWHTARTAVHCKMLFVTPGQDTQNREVV